TIEPKERQAVADGKAEIDRALAEPIGAKRIAEIVKTESKVAIVVDDSTRKTPSEVMLLSVLAELNSAGVKDENVTVIFGCGTHRAVRPDEAEELIGKEAIKRLKFVSHCCTDPELVYVGTTKTHGNKVYINRIFAEADVRVLLGDVNYHYYAGYGGGRKSVLPAVSGEITIKQNHALMVSSNAKAGNLQDNPVHIDMTEAARLAKVDFILNIVENKEGKIVRAFAGDLEAAFLEAVKLVDEMYRVYVDRRAEIVVVSSGGHPADINLYQACKGLDNALDVVKRGGVIILVAECLEGHGNQVFYDWMSRLGDQKTVEKEIKRNFLIGGHKAYYLLKALQNHPLILVSTLPDFYATSIFKFKTARAINDALNEAFKLTGSASRVWAIPVGNYTLAIFKSPEEKT
ncbi:MAG: nickel-dependent lactate racemase, partial [Candidatus Bathyarchaeota archaeon]|nr:nickel-dependent lactate racemase [Candidatus Bathyarchaeota archaeon]